MQPFNCLHTHTTISHNNITTLMYTHHIHSISATEHIGHSVGVQVQIVVHPFLCTLYYPTEPPQSRYYVGVTLRFEFLFLRLF